MKRYIALAILAITYSVGLKAQNDILPSRSLTIEGNYNPSVTDAGKIMPVPDKPHQERQTVSVSYNTAVNPYTGTERKPMVTFGSLSDSVSKPSHTGLVRFGYGLRNLSDGLLDFKWNISERDVLQISGAMNGWSSKPDGEWRSRMFVADLAALYSHRFNSFTLSVDGAYGHSSYNFMPGVAMDSARRSVSDLTLKTDRRRLGLSLSGRKDQVEWFGMASMEWLTRGSLVLNGVERDNSERLLRIAAGASMPMAEGIAGIDYRQKYAVLNWTGLNGCSYRNFTTVTLSPHWDRHWDGVDASFGINLDIRSRAGHKFMMSPQITVGHTINDRFRLDAGMVGGLIDNNMRSLALISPYWSEEERIRDGYELMNLFVGVSYRKSNLVNMSFKAGYRHTIDELFQDRADSLIVTSMLRQHSSDVLYARLDADFQFSDRSQIKFDMTYNDYLGRFIGGYMRLKPAFDGNLYGRTILMPGLEMMLSYRLMAFHRVNGKAMPTVNDLAVTADYDLTEKLSFYATLRQLLGGNYYYYAGYRALKPSFMLGATYRF